MFFNPRAYTDEIAQVLALAGDGVRPMPLVCGPLAEATDATALIETHGNALATRTAHPTGTMAGLWVYFSCFEQAHSIAQDDHSTEGSYWHAILHRQEPDAWNSNYWFRRVGRHAVFQKLAEGAAQLAAIELGARFRPASAWDPAAFVDLCERARTQPGSEAERLALQIQLLEWQLLFDYCARTR